MGRLPATLPLVLGTVAVLAARDVGAQAASDSHEAAPRAEAMPVSGTIHLDGRLDEEAWRVAAPITSFTQLDPREGQPVSQPTEVRVLYDGDGIYVGARLSGP